MKEKQLEIVRGEVYAIKLLFAAGAPLAIAYSLIWLVDYPLTLLGSYLWGRIIDQITYVYTHGSGVSTLWLLLGISMGSNLLHSVILKINGIVKPELQGRSQKILDLRVMRKMATLDAAFFDDPANRDMLKVAENSRLQISEAMTFLVRELIGIGTFAAGLGLFISTAPIVGLIYLATCIPGIIIHTYNKGKMDKYSLSSVPEARRKDYYRSILTGKSYAQEIRLYGLTDFFKAKYNETWNRIRTARYAIFDRGTRLSYLATAISLCGKTFLTVYSVCAVMRGDFTLGTLSMLVSMSTSVGTQFALLLRTIPDHIRITIPRVNRFRAFMAYENEIKTDGRLAITAAPTIEFRDVCFRYPGAEKDVIEHLDLTIPAGKKIALVGLNGAGKTTLVKLLLRFYAPQRGQILLDGRDIGEYSRKSLYRLFGICFQDVCAYSMTVRENIALSDIDRPGRDEAIHAAAKASGADRIYADFAEGLDADLTRKFNDHGHALSGGQWQKLALARAFFRDAQFIIPDEPSSALDPEAEDHLFSSFKAICQDKGGILISHRLSAIMMVDEVVLLRDGRVQERGSHAELMQLDGEYAKLYRLQAEKYLRVGGGTA